MRAHILVVDVSCHAVTVPDGEFRSEGIAPGKHRLKFWHETLRAHGEEIEVEAGTVASMELELKLPESPRER